MYFVKKQHYIDLNNNATNTYFTIHLEYIKTVQIFRMMSMVNFVSHIFKLDYKKYILNLNLF